METAAPAPSRRIGGGRIAATVTLGLLAALLVATGITGVWYRAAHGGWIQTGSHRYESQGRAIVTDAMNVDEFPNWLVAKIRVQASSHKPLFVGVARRAAVDRYLAGVARSTLQDVNYGPFDAEYTTTAGAKTPAPPARQSFWTASSTGSGKQSVTWKIHDGSWRFVVMNADGSPGVAADATAGATVSGALVVALAALGLGLVLGGAAVAVARRD